VSSRQMNLLQSTLDLLILKALGPGELHGLDISRRIEQITQEPRPISGRGSPRRWQMR
jgi:PadR family transcriptional regulator